MVVEGRKMDLVYYDRFRNEGLEKYVEDYGAFLKQRGERPVTVTCVNTIEEVLQQADVRGCLPLSSLQNGSNMCVMTG
jgi:hypothetical protein